MSARRVSDGKMRSGPQGKLLTSFRGESDSVEERSASELQLLMLRDARAMNQLVEQPLVAGLGVEPNVKRDSVGGSTKSHRGVLPRVRSGESEPADDGDWYTVRRKRRQRGSQVKLFDESRKRGESLVPWSSDYEAREKSPSVCSSDRSSESAVTVGNTEPGYLLLSEKTTARTAAGKTSVTVSDVAHADVLRESPDSSAYVSGDSGYASQLSVDRSERDARVRKYEEYGLTREAARARVFEEELSVAWGEAYEEALREGRAKLRDELATLEHERRLEQVREEARELAREQVRVEALEQTRRLEEERVWLKPCLRTPVKATEPVRPTARDQLIGRPSVTTSDRGNTEKELPKKRETVRRRDSWGSSGGQLSVQRSCESSGEESEKDSGQRERSAPRTIRRHRGLLSSDSELEVKSSRESNSVSLTSSERRTRSADSLRALEFLKHWELQFTGEGDHEEAEEFLDRLCECRVGSAVTDRELLAVLPCIFKMQASRWYRAKGKSLRTWGMFCKAFRRRFMAPYCREDLEEDLRKRTQHRDEKIAAYTASLQYLASRFRRPPSERELIRIAYRNLLPEYRRAIGDRCVSSWEDLERYGRHWERLKELNSRYTPPRPAEKMCVTNTAYRETGESQRAAAVVRTTQTGPGEDLPPVVVEERTSEKTSEKPRERKSERTRTERATARRGLVCPTANAVARGEEPGESACFVCNKAGHRALHCPEMICWTCQRKGHSRRECPARRQSQRTSCQLCRQGGGQSYLCPLCRIQTARVER